MLSTYLHKQNLTAKTILEANGSHGHIITNYRHSHMLNTQCWLKYLMWVTVAISLVSHSSIAKSSCQESLPDQIPMWLWTWCKPTLLNFAKLLAERLQLHLILHSLISVGTKETMVCRLWVNSPDSRVYLDASSLYNTSNDDVDIHNVQHPTSHF